MLTASEQGPEEGFWGASHALFYDMGASDVCSLREFIIQYMYASINISSIKCVLDKYKNKERLKINSWKIIYHKILA